MSSFRQTFDMFLRGDATIDATAQALLEDLQRQASLAAVHGAFIEAMYRGGALTGDAYGTLMKHINAAQPQRPVTPPEGGDSDKTILRPGKRQAQQRSNQPALQPETADDAASGTTGSHITTSSTWTDPAQWTATSTGPVGTGSIIKMRFVLEEPLGKGGMGTVYKARDLRKEEAQDRNPYVAIKTLNEDFKRHPQALQALQREARKAQSLAHPNIVTVYDFDRDGTDVYMVMELLEGESLDRLVKRSEGIPAEEAWRIAIEICKGMSFAHQRGIVHADFKPANVFLTRDGAVKIFDFGIARAVKRGGAAGAVTVFDAGTLGALTPAYASCEVIDGQDPDARDDVYAIACVIYELLTGSHPFKRVSADIARAANAVPARPAGLSWWRWRALRRALDFKRERRPASATHLREALSGFVRPTNKQLALGAAAIAVLATVAIAIAVVPGMLARDRESAMIAALASADAKRVETVLPEVRKLDGQQRAAMFLDDGARKGLIKYFEARIGEKIDARQRRYDYPAAELLLRELQGYLADSLAVRNLADQLAMRKNEEIRRQSDWLDYYIKQGVLIPEQGSPNVSGVLQILRSIDPTSRLLTDPRLPGVFVEQTRLALKARDTALAEALVTQGLSLQPNDMTLIDVRDEVRHATLLVQQAAPVQQQPAQPSPEAAVPAQPLEMQSEAQLREQLNAGITQASMTLIQARQLAQIAKEVTRRGAADAVSLERALKIRLANDVGPIGKRRGPEEALRFAEGVLAQFPDSPLLKKTVVDARLDVAERAARRRVVAVERTKQTIEGLLDGTQINDAWPAAIDQQLQQLAAAVPETDTYLIDARRRAAALYMKRAAELRRTQRIAEAGRMLERGRELGADATALLVEDKLLAEARGQQQLDAKSRERAAQISALKEKLLVQAQANQVIDALASLQQLRGSLPKNDPFLTDEAPEAIAGGYLRIASNTARDGRFKEAIDLVDRARALASSRDVNQIRKRYMRYQAIDFVLANRNRIDAEAIRKELAELARPDPDEAAVVLRRLARTLVTRINTEANVDTAARLAAVARELFLPELGTMPQPRNASEAGASEPTAATAPTPN